MPARPFALARFVAGIAALSLAACEIDPTQLLVVINTDLAVPAEIGQVRIRVWGPDQEEPREDRILTLAAAETLPASFGIAPRDGDAKRLVRAAVEGRLGDRFVVATEAATSFVENEVVRLDLFLARSCVGVECEPEQTCRNGSCEDVAIAPGGLPGYSPGEYLGETPPDTPPSRTVLIALDADTTVTHLDLDVATDGSAVIAGSFVGTLSFDEPASSTRWAGFVTRYEPNGTSRYRQIVQSTAQNDAFVYAIAVVDREVTWVSTGCIGSLVVDPMGPPPLPVHTCPLNARVDFRVDSDGAFTLADVMTGIVPAEAVVHLDATPRWVASTYVNNAQPIPWAVTRREPQQADLPFCTLPVGIVPSTIRLDEEGRAWIAGTYDDASAELGLPLPTGVDALVVGVEGPPELPGPCTAITSFPLPAPGDDGAVGLWAAPEGRSLVLRSIDGDAFVEWTGGGTSAALESPDEERLDDVTSAPGGRWVVTGVASEGASVGGTAIGPLEGTEIIALVLDDQLRLIDHRVLGRAEPGLATEVEFDPTTSEVIVLGVTSAPTDLDPDAEGDRAMFLHRFALPAQ